jgi:hypothetical protein
LGASPRDSEEVPVGYCLYVSTTAAH